MRLHALQALIGGVLGIAASVYYRFTPPVTDHLGGYFFFSVVALVFYVAAIAIAVLDRRAQHDDRAARKVKALVPTVGLGSMVCCLALGWTAGQGAFHAVPALILMSALVSMPRSVYDPLL